MLWRQERLCIDGKQIYKYIHIIQSEIYSRTREDYKRKGTNAISSDFAIRGETGMGTVYGLGYAVVYSNLA